VNPKRNRESGQQEAVWERKIEGNWYLRCAEHEAVRERKIKGDR
jgi:hypothetical protein